MCGSLNSCKYKILVLSSTFWQMRAMAIPVNIPQCCHNITTQVFLQQHQGTFCKSYKFQEDTSLLILQSGGIKLGFSAIQTYRLHFLKHFTIAFLFGLQVFGNCCTDSIDFLNYCVIVGLQRFYLVKILEGCLVVVQAEVCLASSIHGLNISSIFTKNL